jgi:hypothetical protein
VWFVVKDGCPVGLGRCAHPNYYRRHEVELAQPTTLVPILGRDLLPCPVVYHNLAQSMASTSAHTGAVPGIILLPMDRERDQKRETISDLPGSLQKV